jgi:hypothetical protein
MTDYFKGIQDRGDGNTVAPFLVSDEPLTLDNFQDSMVKAESQGIKLTHVVLNKDGMVEICGERKFDNFFDPVSKLSTIQEGFLGTLFGLTVLTDAHFHPQAWFLSNRVAYYALPQ